MEGNMGIFIVFMFFFSIIRENILAYIDLPVQSWI